jgi:4-amino-4-deoxy-L-arabinose transferase-like glycosyltransferase
MQSKPGTKTARSDKRRFQLKFLILAAAIWHVSIALAFFAAGKYQLMPEQIYPSGIGRFASDGVVYQEQLAELGQILKNEGPVAWATWSTQLHVRLYSLPLFLVSRWFAFNILTIEPLNLIYYLGILILIFKLGEAAFDYRTGLIAAAVVALWPSFLLHTTQLLRDPLLVFAALLVIWTITESLRTELRFSRGLLLGIAACAAVVVIRITRQPMWYLLIAAVGGATVVLFFRAVRARHVAAGTALFAVMIIAAIVVTPRFQPYFHNQQDPRIPTPLTQDVDALTIPEQISARRAGFRIRIEDGKIVPATDGSKIDPDVKLKSGGEIIQHLPRAVMIGFFAPFPNMWWQAGTEVGALGRLISGFETLLTYMLECFALFGLWRGRRNLSVWFIFGFVVLGAIALGMVVNNVGALYRLRYPFWTLMVILAAGGLELVRTRLLISKQVTG